MRFTRSGLTHAELFVTVLTASDRAVLAAGRASALVALLGLVASGLYLEFSRGAEGPLPYASVRALHGLLGLVLLAVLGYRFCAKAFRGAEKAWGHLRRHGAALPWDRLAPTPLSVLAAAYWLALAVVLASGVEQFFAGRYGVRILPGWAPAIWGKVHAIGTYYLMAFLFLRLFVRGKALLKTLLPYLRGP